jgi:hypothetical protein
MRLIIRSCLTFLVVISLVADLAVLRGATAMEALKTRYKDGSLYLSYGTINDLTNLLNDREKFTVLCSKPSPGAATLIALRDFLNAHRERRVVEAIAFLQLDFVVGRAGYKRLGDDGGSVRQVAWSAQQVSDIAVFCDAFLGEVSQYEPLRASIVSGKAKLGDAWQRIEAAKNDALLPANRVVPMLKAYRILIWKQPNELDKLKSDDPKTHGRIEAFKAAYDESMSRLDVDLGQRPAYYNSVRDRSAIRSLEEVMGTGHGSAWSAQLVESPLQYAMAMGARLPAGEEHEEDEEPGFAEAPKFAWPPPIPSATAKIRRDLLWATTANATPKLKDVAARIERALSQAGYSETSYYSIPDGFAMVARLEQIEADGTPKKPPARFDLTVRAEARFSLVNFLQALFTTQPSRFRLIVFAVTDQPFVADKSKTTDRDEASQWLADGTLKLPERVGKRSFSEDFDVVALIYEFDRATQYDKYKLAVPSGLDGKTHLEKAGLWPPWGN